MAKESKQEVVVSTKKAPESRKAVPARVLHPHEDFERFFDRAFGRSWMEPFAWGRPLLGDLWETAEGRLPSVDVIDCDDHVLVRAEIPGVDRKDLDVSVTDNVLTVKGDVTHEEKEETGDYYRREISRSAFSRSVALPPGVDPEKVNATLKDGVLEITLAKVEGSKRRRIKVQ